MIASKARGIRKIATNTFMVITTFSLTLFMISAGILFGNLSSPSNTGEISFTAHNINFEQGKSKIASRLTDSYLPISSDTFFILVIGNDFRPGVDGRRADGIHIVGVNPELKRSTIINIPRDTNVEIPGRGRTKINAANASGGSDLTRQTVENLMGIQIKYTLEVDFAGFTGIVDNLGGVEVQVEQSMNDKASGSKFEPGLIKMDGGQALAFARDRYSFANGDIQRTTNHGILLISALRELQKTRSSVTGKFQAVSVITQKASLTNLSMRELFFLMELANTFDANQVANITVPWAGSNTLAPSANDLFADFRDNAVLDTYR